MHKRGWMVLVESKKGYFFVIDALVGSAIIFVALLIILNANSRPSKLQYDYTISEDYSSFLINTKIQDISNSYIGSLTNNGTNNAPISNIRNTLMEQIDEFYYKAIYIYNTSPTVNNTARDIYLNYSSVMIQNISDSLIQNNYGFSFTIMDPVKGNYTLYSRSIDKLANSNIIIASDKITFLQINSTTMFGPVIAEVKIWLK